MELSRSDIVKLISTSQGEVIGKNESLIIQDIIGGVSMNCTVLLCNVVNHTKKSDIEQQQYVIKYFGEKFVLSQKQAFEIKLEILKYYQELKIQGVASSLYEGKLFVQKIKNQYLLCAIEEYIFPGKDNFSIIDSPEISAEEKLEVVISDFRKIISVFDPSRTLRIFGIDAYPLKVGLDTKPDNFIIKNGDSIYLDLYPPLLWDQSLQIIPRHSKLKFAMSDVGWTFICGTLEGCILRYLRSTEFRLKNPQYIQELFSSLIEYLKHNIPERSFSYIQETIIRDNFDIINKIFLNRI